MRFAKCVEVNRFCLLLYCLYNELLARETECTCECTLMTFVYIKLTFQCICS